MINRCKSENYLPKKTGSKSGFTNTPTNLSLYTVKFNEKYAKAFETIQNLSSSQSLDFQIKCIKKTIDQKHTKEKLDNIITCLDIITKETRFIKPRIELAENITVKGYLEQNSCQFFEINVKGHLSPVKVNIAVQKGKVESFASFSFSSPNKDFFDKKFESENIEIHSRYNVFIEQKCYIGTYAVSGSSLSVCYYFKSNLEENLMSKENKQSFVKAHRYIQEIQKMRENPDLKIKFEKRVQDILEKRKKKDKLNFVDHNKILASTSLTSFTLSSQIKCKIEAKAKEVKRRKIIITEEKMKALKEKLSRKQIREQSEQQALEIRKVLLKKETFEKK